MNKNLKLLLYIRVNGLVDYSVSPESRLFKNQDGVQVHEIDLPAGQTSNIEIKALNFDNSSHLQVEKISLDGVDLRNMDLWSQHYNLSKTQRKELTYGYMHDPGIYQFKIRQNPLVHNYITYFLSTCK